MPLIRRKLIVKAWRAYRQGGNYKDCFFADFAAVMGMNFKQYQMFSNSVDPVQLSEATARRIKVLAEYPPCHHHTLLKAIDAIYMSDPPQENQ